MMNTTSPTLSDRLVSIRDTCDTLRCGRTKIYELIRSGDLEVVRLGKRSTRIRASSLERFIAGGAKIEA